MKITIIHGQSHKGSTYHIARMIAEKTGGDITEFFLPRDFGEFCTGCFSCFSKSERSCPHYEKLRPITEALDSADVIILASPVYVFHASGAMKALLDHYGYRWMVHRPDEKMFSKQAVCVSTAAGAGMKSTNRDMADSARFWGIAKVYSFGVPAAAVSWKDVSEKKKASIEKAAEKIAEKLKKNCGNVTPSPRTKAIFESMRIFQLKGGISETDASYWKKKGWLGNKRPWH